MHADALRHVKWFTDPAAHPTEWSLLASGPVLLAFAIAIGAVVVAHQIQRRFPEPAIMKTFERFAKIAPTALGIHVGIALLASAALGFLFAPNLRPHDDALGTSILVVEAMCGLMLLLGLATRGAAGVPAVLGAGPLLPFTFGGIRAQVASLGLANLFFIVGRGPVSLARVRGGRPPGQHRIRPHAGLQL